MNTSTRVPGTVEFINITPVNPLISKCLIKVCYVGDEPNRNRSIITKEVAKQIAQSLPGSPIVGHFSKEKKDFEEHNRIITIKNGQIEFTTDTVPYGFVDMNAKVFFEKYDDNGTEHEYLVTEGYIWTGQFPEAEAIIKEGRPQSLEFDDSEETLDAVWTKDEYNRNQFYIINEAVISKLCILGDGVEPCFEGASITAFTLGEEFKNTVYELIAKMQKMIEGGQEMEEIKKEDLEFACGGAEGEKKAEDPAVKKENPEESKKDGKCPEESKKDGKCSEGDCSDKKDPKDNACGAKKYNLEEVVEYTELLEKYNTLEKELNDLKSDYTKLESSNQQLTEFKLSIEREQKNDLIKDFYMLEDADKKDVLDNIDTYSYDEIKSKLCVVCFEKKVDFSPKKDDNEPDGLTYSLVNPQDNITTDVPEWLQAVESYKNNKDN